MKLSTRRSQIWSGIVYRISPASHRYATVVGEILVPAMGCGHYVSARRPAGKKKPLSYRVQRLKVVGIDSREYQKISRLAESRGNPLGQIETIAALARRHHFDAIYGGDRLGLVIFDFDRLQSTVD